jgi:hypothetical protein
MRPRTEYSSRNAPPRLDNPPLGGPAPAGSRHVAWAFALKAAWRYC